MRRMWLLAVLLAASAAADQPRAAEAAPPSGYQCAPGKTNKGVGCTCPATHVDKRDAENNAVCTAKPPPMSYEKLMELADREAGGNCDKAEELWKKALELQANSHVALTGLGFCRLLARDFVSALARFRTALTISPRFEWALEGVADLFTQQGKKDDAIAAWRRYLELYPGNGKATKALERLGALPAAPAPIPTEAEGLWNAGSTAFKSGRLDDAITAYKQLYTKFPGHERAEGAMYFVGYALQQQKKWNDSIAAFQRVIESFPQGSLADDAGYFAAVAAQQLKLCTDALAYAAFVLQKHPTSNVRRVTTELQTTLKSSKSDRTKCTN